MKSIFSQRPVRRRPNNHLLRFESLEQRLALATHVWTGAFSSLWSNSGNWSGGSPAGDAQAVLAFPSAANVNNNNDLLGLKVAAIDFAAGNYVLSGNPITLVQGSLGIFPRLQNAAGTDNTIAIDLGRAATNIGITADIASGSRLTVSGVVSGGAAATNITKEGPGKLVLGGANTFADSVLISAGVLNIQNDTALGTTGDGLTNKTTLNGGTLELQGSLFVTETIVLGAAGGTLRNVSGDSHWTGDVLLLSTDLTAQVEFASSLTITGKISDNVAGPILGMTKAGSGTLALTAANTYRGATLVTGGTLNVNHASALGTPEVGTTLTNQSRLELHGNIAVSEPLVLEQATLRNLSGNNVWQGPITLGLNHAIDVLNSTLTISGVIGGSNAGLIVRDAPGKLILTAANTFEGPVTVLGNLNIRHPLALGPAAQGPDSSRVSVAASGSLELELQGTNSFNRKLYLAGNDASVNGVLRNLSGDNTWAGPVIIMNRANTTIDVSNGQFIVGDGVSGVVPQTSTITKTGVGSLQLFGSPVGLSIIDVNNGTLFVNSRYVGATVRVNGARLGGAGEVGNITNLGGIVGPGVGAGRLTTGNFSPLQDSILEIQLNGTSAGANYDQLRVWGSNIYDVRAALNVHLNFFARLGTTFRIIDNVTAKPIIGTFASLPEGAIISTAFGNLRISYVGGDGNDVVLTVVYSLVVDTNTPSRFPDRSVTAVIDEGGVATLTGTISDPDLHDVFFLDVNWGDGTPTEKHVFPPGSNGQQVQLTHRYLDDDPTGTPQDDYHIQLAWHDKAGEGSSATMTTTVRNVAPVVNAVPDVQLAPSGLLHQFVTFTDPGRDKWTATVDFGDGGGPQPVDVQGGKQLLLHHRYQQPGTYLVRVTVTDDDGGVGRTSFRVRLAGQLEPSRVDAFYGWFDDYQQENKPRRPSLR